jgi:hypothetical protein
VDWCFVFLRFAASASIKLNLNKKAPLKPKEIKRYW